MKMVIDQLKFNPDTKMFPIVGYPMGQSSASFSWNPVFRANNVNEVMWPVEIEPGKLDRFLAAMKTLGVRHFCLTMPHKSAIIPLLDDVDEESRIFNCVNTVKIDPDGTTHGIGMDGRGNLAAIRAAGVDVRGMHVFNLGAGSIVGAILLQLARAGARKATIANRTPERAEKLLRTVREHVDMEVEFVPFDPDSLDRVAAECDFLMQSLPLGMFGYDGDFDYLGFVDKLKPEAVVMENIVNPRETLFVKKALSRGLKVIYGIDMMLDQMGLIFEFCFGYQPKPEHLAAARKNIFEYFGIAE